MASPTQRVYNEPGILITLLCRRCDANGRNPIWQPQGGTCYDCSGTRTVVKRIPLRYSTTDGARIRFFLWDKQDRPALVSAWFRKGEKAPHLTLVHTVDQTQSWTGAMASKVWDRALPVCMVARNDDEAIINNYHQNQARWEAEQATRDVQRQIEADKGDYEMTPEYSEYDPEAFLDEEMSGATSYEDAHEASRRCRSCGRADVNSCPCTVGSVR